MCRNQQFIMNNQWIEEIRKKVDIARAEIDRGEGLEGQTVVNQILERFRQARKDRE
jgi:antitoxin ParD1/3/4